MGVLCSRCRNTGDSTSSSDFDEEEEEQRGDDFSITPAPTAVAGPPPSSRRRSELRSASATPDSERRISGFSSDSVKRNFGGGDGMNVASVRNFNASGPAGGGNSEAASVPRVSERQLNPFHPENDCTDTGRMTPNPTDDFECPAENPSSPAGVDGSTSPFVDRRGSGGDLGASDSSLKGNPSTDLAAVAKVTPFNRQNAESQGILNEPYDSRIGKYLQNKFIRGLALVKVNEGINHPFVCQHAVLLGALQDLKGERVRSSYFSLPDLARRADIILKFRVAQSNEQFNAALLGKNGVFVIPDVLPGEQSQDNHNTKGVSTQQRANNRSILYAACGGEPYLTSVLTQYLPVQPGKAARRKLETEIHTTLTTSTVAPTVIRKGRKSRVKYDREALMWMTSGTERAATFLHTLVPDALMNLDLIDLSVERAPSVAAKMSLTKLYDVAKERAFAAAAAVGNPHGPEFFRLPNVELSVVYIRNNFLYSATTSGFIPPSVFFIHADQSFPEIVEMIEADPLQSGTDDDDTRSVHSLRSTVSTNSMSSTSSASKLVAPKMRYDIPAGTRHMANLGSLIRSSTTRHLDAASAPLIAVVIATPTFWNVLQKTDVAEMMKCMLDLDKSVMLRSALSDDVAPLIRRYRTLRSFVKKCEAEQKLMAAHEEAAAVSSAPPHPSSSGSPVAPLAPRRLRNMNQDMCETLRDEAVLRCGKDETNRNKCAVSLLTIRVDRL
jgi:hypothetical protein